MRKYSKIAWAIPPILVPGPQIDMSRWAVVACDQYTSEPEYWKEVEDWVGDAPSTLHLVYPEVYLDDPDKAARIQKIHQTMEAYLSKNIFQSIEHPIYVQRFLGTKVRQGLVVALDLEEYDFSPNAQSLIRATEGTILDRLPPRMEIRRQAPLETPHIMVLFDDPEDLFFQTCKKHVDEMRVLYDFELMMKGGLIKGWAVPLQVEAQLVNILENLAQPEDFRRRYQLSERDSVLLYAMGDGNHSLATAKAIWEEIKQGLTEEARLDHPARYALVELVNLHDLSLDFEPIHRLLFGVQRDLLDWIKEVWGQKVRIEDFEDFEKMIARVDGVQGKQTHVFGMIWNERAWVIEVLEPTEQLVVGTLQKALDQYKDRGLYEDLDYIHGFETLVKLSGFSQRAGFYLPKMNKGDLFRTVVLDGVLPRKTFSMGEAHEKRFYLECRSLIDG